MKIPKRFKLHEAAGAKDSAEHAWASVRFVRHESQTVLVASNGHVLAVVPVLPEDDYSGRDLPKMQAGEGDGPEDPAMLPLGVVKAALQGKVGEGELRVNHPQANDGHVYGRSDPLKSWTVAPLRDGAFPDTWADLESLAAQEAPGHAQLIEVCLDAEALVRAARAIGHGEGVRLRFLVTKATGRLDGASPIVEVRPARDPDRGEWASMGAIIVRD